MRVVDVFSQDATLALIPDGLIKEEIKKQNRFRGDYIIYNRNKERESVLCRQCGEVIAGLHEKERKADPITGNVTSVKFFGPTSEYSKVTLVLDNGTIVSVPMCVRCANNIVQEDIEPLYLSEIYAHAYDGIMRNAENAVLMTIEFLIQHAVERRL